MDGNIYDMDISKNNNEKRKKVCLLFVWSSVCVSNDSI